ncbi:MAG: hypothetical protein SGJ00_02610 [bacterium]|nr:hypothetical protein [bacterium]
MKKNPIYLYGAIIILEGVFLLFSKYYSFDTLRYSLGTMMIIGAILGLLRALTPKTKHVEFTYHEMHVLAMVVYGLSVLLFANKLEKVVNFSAYLFFFYAFSEIIFCSLLFNLGKGVVYKIVFIRAFLGISVGLGMVIIMNYYSIHKAFAVEGFGILFILIGINILLYVPVMKAKEFIQASNNTQISS